MKVVVKKIMVGALCAAIITTGTTVSFANPTETDSKEGLENNSTEVEECYTGAYLDFDNDKLDEDDMFMDEDFKLPSYKEFINEFELDDVTKEDNKFMEKAYNKAIELESAEKYEEEEKQWEEFDKKLEKYFKYDIPNIEDFLKDMEIENVTNEDKAAMEKAYNKAIELEEAEKYEEAKKQWEEFDKTLDKYFEYEILSFEDFLKDIELENVTEEDKLIMKKAYDKVIALEEADKYEEAEKQWEEFDKTLDKYFEYEILSFEDFLKEMEIENVTNEDKQIMKKAYNKVIALEEADKYEEAEKQWEEFDKTLEKYFKYEMQSFEDFLKDMELENVTSDDKETMKNAYNKAIELEEAEQFEESQKMWEEFDKTLNKYFEYEMPSFEDLLKDMELDNITSEDKIIMENAYDKAVALEESEKYEEAYKQWEVLYEKISKYYNIFEGEDI